MKKKEEIKGVYKTLYSSRGIIHVNVNDEKVIYINNTVIPLLKGCDVNIFDLLGLSENFEHPDGYYLSSDGILYLIEHFEVDISKKSKNGGSIGKEKLSCIDTQVEKAKKSGEDYFLSNSALISGTVGDFLYSITYALNKHYSKINSYKDNVMKDLKGEIIKDVKVVFLIENAMPLGSYFVDEHLHEIVNLSIFEYSPFLEILKDKTDVDYFMYFTKVFGGYPTLYVESVSSLNKKVGNEIDLSTDLTSDSYLIDFGCSLN